MSGMNGEEERVLTVRIYNTSREPSHIVDLQRRDLKNVEREQVPYETETLILSNNQLTALTPGIFDRHFAIFDIDLSFNELTSLKALVYFKGLNELDLRHNCLEIDELLDLRHIHIFHLRLSDNNFQKYTHKYPLTIIALLKRCWIIDGTFITDHTRAQAKEFKKTINFSNTILAARRSQPKELRMAGATSSAQSFLAGTSCKFIEPGKFMHPHCRELALLSKHSQLERLGCIKRRVAFRFDLIEGNFLDYLSLVMGILGHHWMKVPIEWIARTVEKSYWQLNSTKISVLENWEEWKLLATIVPNVHPNGDTEVEVWNALCVSDYMESGVLPVLGSKPRLLLCSVLSHSGLQIQQLEEIDDMKVYFKFKAQLSNLRQISEDSLLSSVHREMLGELPFDSPRIPKRKDVLAVRHPLTDTWVNSTIFSVEKGRIFASIGQEIVVQLPIAGLFWDGRGKWRESVQVAPRPSTSLSKSRDKMFLTVSQAVEEIERSVSRPASRAIIKGAEQSSGWRVSPMDREYFLQKGREGMRKCGFMPKRTERSGCEFRGIVDPVMPPLRSVRRGEKTRTPDYVVQKVTNISFGREIAPGRRIRKFHVEVKGMTSKKMSYICINEDEIGDEDVRRLCELFRRQIESKMVVVPVE
jgi:hypothetical protein